MSLLAGLVVFSAFQEVKCCPHLNGCIIGEQPGGAPPPPPNWPAGIYCSQYPHNVNLAISVQLTQSVRNWGPDMVLHYDNARGAWNSDLGRLTFQDLPLNSFGAPVVWVVRPGTQDESDIHTLVGNAGFQFNESCFTSGGWATVRWAGPNTQYAHTHHRLQKVCIKGTDSAPTAPDQNAAPPQQLLNFRFLMIMHELGHVLSLPDLYNDPQSCLMKNGTAMRYVCLSEISWVKAHYGAAGGY